MKNPGLTKSEVAQILENFVDGRGGPWDWDAFLSETFEDERLRVIQMRCAYLSQEFPPERRGGYTNEQGFQVIRDYAKQLKAAD